jgi:hypothetical protein
MYHDYLVYGGIVMHAYSQDLRDRVLGALERGERPSEIARRFEVSRVGSIKFEIVSEMPGNAAVIRSAVIGVRGLHTWR